MSDVTLEYGEERRSHIDKYDTISYTSIIYDTVEIQYSGIEEPIVDKQCIKIFEDGYVKCMHMQYRHEKMEEDYKMLKTLTIKERLEYVENLKKSLNNIEKFNL